LNTRGSLSNGLGYGEDETSGKDGLFVSSKYNLIVRTRAGCIIKITEKR
jgi:hypothetical protein